MKFLKDKSWIDWLKVIVAVDIAAVGISLVFQHQIHILANIFGPISRIIFGVLYLVVAAAIFRGVFPEFFREIKEKNHPDTDSQESGTIVHENDHPPQETIGEVIDNTAKKVNDFIKKRSEEVKDEVNKVL
jgi:hypothetical protein